MVHTSLRKRTVWQQACFALAGLALLLSFPPSAAAEEVSKAACVEAYTQAQRLRKDSHLQAAREQLLICAKDACPGVIKPDCARWLTEVESALPSLVFAAKGPDGSDTGAVQVQIDGTVVAEQLDGRAIIVDPGTYDVHFEMTSAAVHVEAIEKQIVVRQGEQNRLVSVSWAPAEVAGPTGPSSGGDRPVEVERGTPVAALVVGGLGVVALGSFAAFGIIGSGELDELRDTCGTTGSCSEDEVDGARTKLIVADVSLAVGLVGIGIGAGLLIYHYVSDSGPATESAGDGTSFAFGASPLPGGASASFQVVF